MPREPAPGLGRGTPRHEPYALCPRHHEGRAHQGVQQRRHDPRLHLHRRHRRVHEVVQERQEPAEVGQLLDAGHKMPAGSLTRPREIFFKKCGGGIDKHPAFVYI